MICPKLVCLDSSTWGHLARSWNRDIAARSVVELLKSGGLVPFLTWHHLEELCNHGDDSVFEERVALLRSLPYIAFPKLPQEMANVGSLIELRDAEIAALMENPSLPFDALAEKVRANITNGFCSGREFCAANYEWWNFFRINLSAQQQARKTEIASVVQFPFGNQKTRLDREGPLRLRSPAAAKAKFAEMTQELADKLRSNGDRRIQNPEKVAATFLRSVYEEGLAIRSMEGKSDERLGQLYNVDLKRLAKGATNEDFGYEAIFMEQLRLHEESFGLPKGAMSAALTQDMIPSWIVWREVDRGLKALPKAESGNINDKHIISFALYIDAVECDKRVRDAVERTSRKFPLFQSVQRKLLSRPDMASLLAQLQQLEN